MSSLKELQQRIDSAKPLDIPETELKQSLDLTLKRSRKKMLYMAVFIIIATALNFFYAANQGIYLISLTILYYGSTFRAQDSLKSSVEDYLRKEKTSE